MNRHDKGTITPVLAGGRWPIDVALWRIDVRDDTRRNVMAFAGLDVAERARADRFVRHEDRMRFAVTRSALRSLLGTQVDAIPSELVFAVSERGRPELRDYPSLSFNVAHSGDTALIGISNRRLVGIDVERLDPLLDWRGLMALVCTEDEQRKIRTASKPRKRELFMRCWVAKEALLKALGVGIGDGLLGLEVDPTQDDILQPLVNDKVALAAAQTLHFRWLSDIDGYPACIAYGPARNDRAGPPSSRDESS